MSLSSIAHQVGTCSTLQGQLWRFSVHVVSSFPAVAVQCSCGIIVGNLAVYVVISIVQRRHDLVWSFSACAAP